MRLPEKVNVLLLGSGGREHAFATAIARSPRLQQLFIAPGNAGTAALGTNVEINPNNFGTIKQFVTRNNVNLVVVGPEEPLVKGIYDFFDEDPEIRNIPVIGPSAAGARLEGSKDFAKGFMSRHAIPTAAYRSFTAETLAEGQQFLETLQAPYVLKADGLAAGKGVLIIDSLEEAKAELAAMLEGKFGTASETVVIEEHLKGIECSVFVATDGINYKVLPVAKDYKRVGEGDTGPNTGGMGAVSPPPFADDAFMQKVTESIIIPTVEGLRTENIPYKGFIFIGLIADQGEPKVIEYNVRMGDPETEVVLPRITSDILGLFAGIAHGALDKYDLEISPDCAVTVVAVSQGYPGDYPKGLPITGLEEAAQANQSIIYHAGTILKAGKVLTNGGRVLVITSTAKTIPAALKKSYATLTQIQFEGIHYRPDIGKDLTQGE